MYTTCPKCGHTRNPESNEPADRCPSCGLVYRKWFNSRFRSSPSRPDHGKASNSRFTRKQVTEYLLFTNPEQNRVTFYFHGLVWMLLTIWSWQFFSMDYYYYVDEVRIDSGTPEIYSSFLHNVNLVFHEAGHILFMPFGRLMTQLGGSLMQIIMPLVVTLAFLIKERNNFGAAVGLWWTGQNLMDLAPYINDAVNMQIPLLGGGTGVDRPGMHDWNNVLSSLGALDHAQGIAAFINGLGIQLMLLALTWGILVLLNAYRIKNKR